MSAAHQQTPLDDLIAAHLVDDLSDAQRQELNELLQRDPEARAAFIISIRRDVLLGEVLRERAEAKPRRRIDRRKKLRHTRKASSYAWWLGAAACAAIVIGVVAALLSKTDTPPTSEVPPPISPTAIAVLKQVEGTVAVQEQGKEPVPAQAEMELIAGQEVSVKGKGSRAVIAYTDGTRVDLSSDTRITLSDDHGGKRVNLDKGGLSADVAKQPIGKQMVLTTPHAKVRVLGTKLEVAAMETSTRLAVTEGSVQVTRLTGTTKTIRVDAGHYAIAAANVSLAAHPLRSAHVPEGYRLTFADNFDSFTLDKKGDGSHTWAPWFVGWNARYLKTNNDKAWQCDASYTGDGRAPLGVTLHELTGSSTLKLYTRPTPADKSANAGELPYVGGMITSERSFSRTYGYWEVRCRFEVTQGVRWTVWLWPSDEGSSPPEVLPVVVSGHQPDQVMISLRNPATDKKDRPPTFVPVAPDASSFHTYGFKWTPKEMVVYIDGEEKRRQPNLYDNPMYLMIYSTVDKWSGQPDRTTVWPSVCEIDYIRVYSGPDARIKENNDVDGPQQK